MRKLIYIPILFLTGCFYQKVPAEVAKHAVIVCEAYGFKLASINSWAQGGYDIICATDSTESIIRYRSFDYFDVTTIDTIHRHSNENTK